MGCLNAIIRQYGRLTKTESVPNAVVYLCRKENTMRTFRVISPNFEETIRLAAAMPSIEMTLTIYHSELAERERKILSLEAILGWDFSWLKDESKKEEVQSLLLERYRILSEMFELHCSDSEAETV